MAPLGQRACTRCGTFISDGPSGSDSPDTPPDTLCDACRPKAREEEERRRSVVRWAHRLALTHVIVILAVATTMALTAWEAYTREGLGYPARKFLSLGVVVCVPQVVAAAVAIRFSHWILAFFATAWATVACAIPLTSVASGWRPVTVALMVDASLTAALYSAYRLYRARARVRV
jgi:hypothetical protein